MAVKLNNSVVTRDCAVGGVVPTYLQPLVDLRSGVTGIPITDLTGRLSVQSDIFVGGLTYEDYAMRRKAETLQYNTNSAKDTKKALFGKMQYRKKMKNVDLTNSCPVVIYPPSNSGVKDLVFPGYYFNRNVPYRSSI
jgi:hypothetical protein